MKIRKAIIPAAGLGTRFLPATKAMPKEMLPIVDNPTIQYILEEAVASGIEDIIIVTGKGKRAIEDHFDNYFELEYNLRERGKIELLSKIKKPSEMADIHYIRQKEPKGLGHAIWCARKSIGGEPFAVLLGDDIVQVDIPCIRQLMNIYNSTNKSVIGVQAVAKNKVSRHGIFKYERLNNNVYDITSLVEKPKLEDAPSKLTIMGRRILTPRIFDILENQEVGAGGEFQLTDAINTLNRLKKVYAYEFERKRYDVGIN